MGNKKGLLWYCVIFTNPEKSEIFKVLKCRTISEMSYFLDIQPQILRNYYHKQIKARGVLKYCKITQNLNI
tara:strand:- start:1681 stop:1893 length:213 start_codon:yes stop_codon:yes gene_type:complete